MAFYEILGQLIINGLVYGAIYALIGVGMTFILGIIGIINVAHGAFYMIAGYITLFIAAVSGVNPIVALPVVILTMFIVGLFIQLVVVEPIQQNGDAVMIATFGLAYLLEGLVLFIFGGNFQSSPPILPGNLSFAGFHVLNQQALAGIFSVLSLVLVGLYLSRTKIGIATRSVAEDREASSILGIRVRSVSFLSFGIGVCLVGLAGSLLASVYPVYPSDGWSPLLIAFAVVVLGGMGSFRGSFIAGVIFGTVQSFLEFYFPRLTAIGPLLILISVMMIRPSGIIGRNTEKI